MIYQAAAFKTCLQIPYGSGISTTADGDLDCITEERIVLLGVWIFMLMEACIAIHVL
jgi:hypothetical protein